MIAVPLQQLLISRNKVVPRLRYACKLSAQILCEASHIAQESVDMQYTKRCSESRKFHVRMLYFSLLVISTTSKSDSQLVFLPFLQAQDDLIALRPFRHIRLDRLRSDASESLSSSCSTTDFTAQSYYLKYTLSAHMLLRWYSLGVGSGVCVAWGQYLC